MDSLCPIPMAFTDSDRRQVLPLVTSKVDMEIVSIIVLISDNDIHHPPTFLVGQRLNIIENIFSN